jgi:hypothetical protein
MKKAAIVVLGSLLLVAPERSAGQGQQQQQSPSPQQRQQQSASQQAPAPSSQQRPPEYRERYSVLVERNIFLRNRSRPPVRTPSTNPSGGSGSQGTRRPEQSFLLTGIVLEEGRRIAFIENTSAGTTERLAVGAAVAGGKIVEVDFHHLEFESASGQRSKVEIGKTLAGGERSGGGGGGGEVAGTQPSDTSAPVDPSKANLTPEERLRLKRQQESQRLR